MNARLYVAALKAFVMPDDLLPDHLITQIHSYLPAKFVTAKADHREEFYESDIDEIDAMFALVNKYIVEKVILVFLESMELIRGRRKMVRSMMNITSIEVITQVFMQEGLLNWV